MKRARVALVSTAIAAASGLVVVGVAGVACDPDGVIVAATDAGADADAPLDASTVDARDAQDIFVRGDAGCPVAIPPPGVVCDQPGLWCEYGDGGTHSLCTTKVHCDVLPKSGNVIAWQIITPAAGCGVEPADCPTTFGEQPDAACPSQGVCDYAEGRCGCITCNDYDGSPEQDQWMCRAWSSIPAELPDGTITTSSACATERPRLGTPCTDHTVVCGYDACEGISLGPYLACADFPGPTQGTWVIGAQTDSCNKPGCR